MPFEKRLLRLLAARYAMRLPINDTPRYAAGEDARVPSGMLNRSGMIALAFEFMDGNRLKGDYFEFGSWGGRTFRMAFEHHRTHYQGQVHFWLFDSFQGLPELSQIDQHPKWKAGDLSTSLDEFIGIAEAAGIPRACYTLTPGFYQETLTPDLAARLSAKTRAGIVYVDCDLYESAITVLEFMHPLLQPGTVVCFDDYYCFDGSPERGEQLAIKEFLEAHPDMAFVDYARFGWHGKSFIVHCPGTTRRKAPSAAPMPAGETNDRLPRRERGAGPREEH